MPRRENSTPNQQEVVCSLIWTAAIVSLAQFDRTSFLDPSLKGLSQANISIANRRLFQQVHTHELGHRAKFEPA